MNRHVPAPEIRTIPSEDATGSVALGNGEVAANVWFTPDGVLHILLARTDAWDEAHRLCKLGLVELSFEPDGTEELKQGFEHSLSLRDASLTIRLGDPSQPFRTTRVWIDRHRDVLWLESESTKPSGVSGRVVRLQTAPEETSASAMGKLSGDVPVAVRVGADSGFGPDELGRTAMAVAHHNEDSVYPGNLEMQKLDGFDPLYRENPLLHRVFGAALSLIPVSALPRQPHHYLTAPRRLACSGPMSLRGLTVLL